MFKKFLGSSIILISLSACGGGHSGGVGSDFQAQRVGNCANPIRLEDPALDPLTEQELASRQGHLKLSRVEMFTYSESSTTYFNIVIDPSSGKATLISSCVDGDAAKLTSDSRFEMPFVDEAELATDKTLANRSFKFKSGPQGIYDFESEVMASKSEGTAQADPKGSTFSGLGLNQDNTPIEGQPGMTMSARAYRLPDGSFELRSEAKSTTLKVRSIARIVYRLVP
jgi:hypothetical protein